VMSFYFNNVICPFIAVMGGVLIKIKKSTPSIIRITRWAFTFSMLDALVIALLFVAPEVSMISRWIFDDSIELCTELTRDTDDECLVISGTMLTGGYFMCAAAICFDVFMVTTLWGLDKIEKDKRIMRDEMQQLLKERNGKVALKGVMGEAPIGLMVIEDV